MKDKNTDGKATSFESWGDSKKARVENQIGEYHLER